MSLLKGTQNVRKNITELTHGKIGPARRKAIHTLAKKWGISESEAKFRQALIIAKSKAQEK